MSAGAGQGAARVLRAEALTREAFAPFGDVVQTEGARHYTINAGTTERFHDLAAIDVLEDGGRALLSLFRSQPVTANPCALWVMERHPLSSQAFVPRGEQRFLVVVAPPAATFEPATLRAFITAPGQGVNYARGVWHHPVLALGEVTDFLIVDRGGPGENCDEVELADPVSVAY